MPSAAEVNAALARSQSLVSGPPSADAVNAALARRQAARPQGTLTLNKSPADRALQVGARSMGSPDPQATGGWGERIRGAAASVATPWVGSAKGIHQLMGGSPEELSKYDATMAELIRQSPQGSGRLAGNLAGEALQFAIPGGVGAKAGAKLLGLMPRFAARRGVPAAAVATGEAGGIGGFEALATPGTEDERTAAGLTGAGATLLGHGVGAPLMALANKLRTGVKPKHGAQGLQDQGVPLTPGQKAQSPIIQKLEENMGFVPLVSDKVEKLQRASVEAAQPWAMQKTLPDLPGFAPVKITGTGRDGFRQAYKAHGDRFDQFWERAYNRLGDDGSRIVANSIDNTVAGRAGSELSDESAQALSRMINTASQRVQRSPGRDSLQQFNRTLQDGAADAWIAGNRQEAGILQDVIGDLEKTFGDAAPLLKEINRGYAGLKVLERAGSYKSALQEGYIAPENLMSAVKAEGRPKQLVLGEAVMQPEADTLNKTIGGLVPKGNRLGERFATIGAAGGMAMPKTRMLTLAMLLGGRGLVNDPTRRLLTGQTWLQQKIPAEALEKLRATLAQIQGKGAAGYAATERGE